MKKVWPYIIEVALYISFAYMYLINVVGGGVYKYVGITSTWGAMAVGGVLGVGIFELVLLIVNRYFKMSIKDFGVEHQRYFKSNIRLLAIARNVLMGSLNFVFMIYPVSSIWGMMISYIILTSLMAYVWFSMYCNKFQQNKSEMFLRMSSAYVIFIIVYAIFSGGVL